MNKTIFKKRAAALAAAVILCSAMAVAQEARTHVVQRGETLESIAESYGVTADDIIRLNSDAAQFVYVGMELRLPEKAKRDATEAFFQGKDGQDTGATLVSTEATAADNKGQKLSDEGLVMFGDFAGAMEIGYGFLDADGSGASAFGFTFTAGANYFFTEKAYAGARIGYNGSFVTTDYGDSSVHLIAVPVEAGYVFKIGEGKTAIVPYGGLGFNIGLSGKTKIKGMDDIDLKVGGKIGMEFDLGVRLRLWGWNVSGSYRIPLNDKQKGFFGDSAFFQLGLGFGF